MPEEKKEEKKIIIDEDWKAQAQKEKELLSQKTEEEKKKAEKTKARRGPLPKGDMGALINLLVTQALFAMGLLQFEGQQEKEPDLSIAKYNIDMLETLEEKTKGNLTDEESNALTHTLSELRMAYVKISEKK
jgi:hypothetical protein